MAAARPDSDGRGGKWPQVEAAAPTTKPPNQQTTKLSNGRTGKQPVLGLSQGSGKRDCGGGGERVGWRG